MTTSTTYTIACSRESGLLWACIPDGADLDAARRAGRKKDMP